MCTKTVITQFRPVLDSNSEIVEHYVFTLNLSSILYLSVEIKKVSIRKAIVVIVHSRLIPNCNMKM